MRNRPATTSAFTLLELVLVMSLITIMVGVMAPTFQQSRIGRYNGDAARLVVSLSQYAHTQAMTEGRVYRLNFDSSKRSIWLTVQAEQGATFAAPTDDMGRPFTVADTVSFRLDLPKHDDGNYFTFQPSGRNESGRVWFTNAYGGVVEVECASATEPFRVVPPKEMTQ